MGIPKLSQDQSFSKFLEPRTSLSVKLPVLVCLYLVKGLLEVLGGKNLVQK